MHLFISLRIDTGHDDAAQVVHGVGQGVAAAELAVRGCQRVEHHTDDRDITAGDRGDRGWWKGYSGVQLRRFAGYVGEAVRFDSERCGVEKLVSLCQLVPAAFPVADHADQAVVIGDRPLATRRSWRAISGTSQPCDRRHARNVSPLIPGIARTFASVSHLWERSRAPRRS